MKNHQWMALWNEALTANGWTDYLKQTEQWSNQGMNLWTDLQAFIQTHAPSQIWINAALEFSDQWKAALKNWGATPLPRKTDVDEKEIVKLKIQRDDAQANLKAQKQEMTKLKRTITQKEKQLNKETATVDQQREALAEKDQQIRSLEARLEQQTTKLNMLEAQTRKAIPKAVPATQTNADTNQPSSK